MSLDAPNLKLFLEELNRQTKSNLQTLVSMYEVGATIGFAKGEAGALAEELMVTGLVELRTLAGGISITQEGLSSLGIFPATPSADIEQKFSKGPTTSKADLEILHRLIDSIRAALCGLHIEYNKLEEIIIDLKTIEVQLLSPAPKIAVFREILRSLHTSFSNIDNKEVLSLLASLIR